MARAGRPCLWTFPWPCSAAATVAVHVATSRTRHDPHPRLGLARHKGHAFWPCCHCQRVMALARRAVRCRRRCSVHTTPFLNLVPATLLCCLAAEVVKHEGARTPPRSPNAPPRSRRRTPPREDQEPRTEEVMTPEEDEPRRDRLPPASPTTPPPPPRSHPARTPAQATAAPDPCAAARDPSVPPTRGPRLPLAAAHRRIGPRSQRERENERERESEG
ncbi:hypothetical protein PVAP13_8NG162202 [Panicum virgatum]|uniref:Uncharacterized protein n=1 Tax=Panicum virgatum TaxID=38727 RepID=A0A8T0P5S3_PANVG|nr:hypothetical protein PVAP13_8NG162202 [Panicum virgatum]